MDLKSKQMLNNHHHITSCLSGLSQAPLIINGNNNNSNNLLSGNCDNVSERSTPNSVNSFNSPNSLNSFNSPNRITLHHNHNHHHHQKQPQHSPLILSCNSTTITSTSSNSNNNAQSSIFFPPLAARSSHHQLASTLVTTATSTKIVDRSPRSADINMNAEGERNRESSSSTNFNDNDNSIHQHNKQHNSNNNQLQHHHQRFSSTASQQSSNLNSPIIMPAKSFAGFFSEPNNFSQHSQQQFQQPSVRRSINLGSTSTNNNSPNGAVVGETNNWPHQEQQIDDSYHLYHEPIDPEDDEQQQPSNESTTVKSNQQLSENNNSTNKTGISSIKTVTPPPIPIPNSRVSTPTTNQHQQETSRSICSSSNPTILGTTTRKNDVSADIYFCYVSMKSNERSNQRSRSYHGPKNSTLHSNINNNNNQAALSSTSFADLPTTNTLNVTNNDDSLTMRDHCINELIGTEMNYTHALNHILTYFAKPLEQFLRKEENQLIFGHMKYFYSVHTSFQADLVKHAPNVSVCFLNSRDKFLRYGEYCATLLRAQALLDDIVNRNDAFATQLDRCHHEANEGKFKLADLLSLPMQRILKYHLLLAELIKNTRSIDEDFNGLKRAYDAMIDLGKYINEAKRDTELMQIIDDIEQSISGLNMPSNTKLTDYGKLHFDGIIRVKLPSYTESTQHKLTGDKIKQKRYAFVFDKVLLMCKVGIKGYQYKEALVLSEYVLDTDPIIVQSDTISAKHLIREKWTYNFNLIKTVDQTTYSFFAKDLDMKSAWIEAIQKAFDNIKPAVCRNNNIDHEFLMHTFERASSCDHCGKLFHGLHYQGYRCRTCFASAHKNCLAFIRPCGPTLPPKPIVITNNNTLSPQIIHRDSKEQISPSIRSNSSDDSHNFFNHFPRALNELSIKDNNSNNINLTTTSLTPNGRNENVNNYVNFRLNDHLWFCGRMERNRAQELLQNMPDGTFLVRVSPKHNGSSVISLKHNFQVKHMRINVSKDNEFYLSQNRYFKSVIELVSWYEKNSLVESFHMLDSRLAIPYKANQPTI